MARPGITRWRSSNSPPTEGSDEVQRSLELLDQVLSEFDDLENGNVAAREVRAQLSEDDGYMSMNGRRAKFVLNFRPPPPDGDELPPTPEPCGPPPPELADFPPPPEEAERIISTLLPKVSPGNSAKRAPGSVVRHGAGKVSSFTLGPHFGSHDSRVTTATQTTLPKTRHQRPFGWENGHTSHPHLPSHKFGSLPYDNSHQWLSHGPVPLPPRTCPTVVDRHREVRRRTPEEENGEAPMKTLSETTDDDHANFSDDSLEELLPPPPPTSKRSSIAWEVPLDLDEEALLTPGSTKVVGRRRRKSTDRSSTGSTSRLRDQEDWPDPPTGTEDGSISPFSDWDSSAGKLDDGSFLPPELSASDLSASGTYVIRKGRRKERTPVSPTNKKPEKLKQSPSPNSNSKLNELKRCSSTFDNIKSLLKEGLIEGLDETPPDFQPPTPPALVRVVSLPTLTIDETCQTEPLQIVEERVTEPPKPTEEVKTVESKSVEVEVKSCDVGIQVMDDLPLLNSSEKHKESVEESTQVSLEYRDVNDDKSTELSKSCDSVVDSIDSRTEEALILKLQQDQSEDFSSSEDILSPSFTSCAKQVNSFEVAKQEIISDPWLTAAEISEVQVIPVVEEKSKVLEVNGVKEEEEKCEKPPGDFNVMVEVLQHEFGPLPPSPVEEDEDEYNDVLRNSPVRTSRGKADSVPEPFYRCLEPPGSDPIGAKFLNRPCPDPPPHKEPTSSLKTRSMDAGFSRNHKNQHSNSRRDIPSERRTLPSELPGPSRRRTFQKRGSSQSPREEGHMQVSCSLPETPIFARGCDIPRTPHRRAPEIPPAGTRTTPRPPGIQTSSYRRTPTTVGHGTTGSTTTLGQAMVGAELLRLTGGPGRGWYPRHRNPRPASVEHLDHLAHPTAPAHGWDASQSRKPLTLPPNLTPKFFHRSPREALRRVTSLLIRKGNSKDSKKDQLSPTQAFGANGEEGTRQKRGFFKSFWKRSRHYSLEQQ